MSLGEMMMEAGILETHLANKVSNIKTFLLRVTPDGQYRMEIMEGPPHAAVRDKNMLIISGTDFKIEKCPEDGHSPEAGFVGNRGVLNQRLAKPNGSKE